jgi:hypothetical protein
MLRVFSYPTFLNLINGWQCAAAAAAVCVYRKTFATDFK